MTANLIEAAQQGDIDAYEQLIAHYGTTVERFALQCGAQYHDVPDISQEVFIRLYRFLHQFNQERFTTWLYKVTLNATRDHYRKQGVERSKEQKVKEGVHLSHSTGSDYKILVDEQDKELHACIQSLDEKYRYPLVLYYFQDCSYNQIAEVLSLPLATVKIRIHRSKDLLRGLLEKGEVSSHGGA